MYEEDDYLLLSGIQHFAFCRRQWALIHIEQQWQENFSTADGRIMHENAHDSSFRERRGNIITARGLRISSAKYGITGECDVVEFHRDDIDGVNIYGLSGKYIPVPVEYKRGSPKEKDCDRIQLCAQVLCLEDMLCCEIKTGYLYYGETRRRTVVAIDRGLRDRTAQLIFEMHELYDRRYTPKVKQTKSCYACSLKNICLPTAEKLNASNYIKMMMEEDK